MRSGASHSAAATDAQRTVARIDPGDKAGHDAAVRLHPSTPAGCSIASRGRPAAGPTLPLLEHLARVEIEGDALPEVVLVGRQLVALAADDGTLRCVGGEAEVR